MATRSKSKFMTLGLCLSALGVGYGAMATGKVNKKHEPEYIAVKVGRTAKGTHLTQNKKRKKWRNVPSSRPAKNRI